MELYMFRTVSLSIIGVPALYTQQQVYAVQVTVSSIPKINLRIYCISLILLEEYITMRGPLNVKIH